MMAKVEELGNVGILAWHPDRLARNSVDGGRVIYAVDTSKIVSLRFPTFWFEPTPQGGSLCCKWRSVNLNIIQIILCKM